MKNLMRQIAAVSPNVAVPMPDEFHFASDMLFERDQIDWPSYFTEPMVLRYVKRRMRNQS